MHRGSQRAAQFFWFAHHTVLMAALVELPAILA